MLQKKNGNNHNVRNLDPGDRSDVRFRTMFETAAVGIGILSLDRKLLDANSALFRMFGYTREELIGKSPAIITYQKDSAASSRQFKDLVEGKNEYFWGERRYVCKSGEVFWAQVTMSLVRDENGTPLYMVGMLIDINDQKKTVVKLQQSEARFKAMFENTSVGIALTELNRKIIEVNDAAARITGYSLDELKNIDPIDLSIPEDRQIGELELQEMIAGKRSGMTVERRFVRKSGEIFWGRVTYSLVRSRTGKPQYLIGLIEDISEQKLAASKIAEQEAAYRKNLEQNVEARTRELSEANLHLVREIEQRQHAEEALASKAVEEAILAERTRLAHELHDAVTQTLFSASLIAEVLPELWEINPDEARKSNEELRQLTRGALAEMRTLLLELRPAALTQARFPDLVKQLCDALIGRARLPVNLEVEGTYELPPEIKVAFYRIAQESLNNIVKYARATRVEIKIHLDCCDVRMEIIDDGVGFEQDNLKPTSLGLRIMRERAEAIHAHLKVSSAPGMGTSVRLSWNEDDLIPLTTMIKNR